MVIGNWKLIKTITIPITIGKLELRESEFGNVVDSTVEPQKTNYNYFLKGHTKNTNVQNQNFNAWVRWVFGLGFWSGPRPKPKTQLDPDSEINTF